MRTKLHLSLFSFLLQLTSSEAKFWKCLSINYDDWQHLNVMQEISWTLSIANWSKRWFALKLFLICKKAFPEQAPTKAPGTRLWDLVSAKWKHEKIFWHFWWGTLGKMQLMLRKAAKALYAVRKMFWNTDITKNIIYNEVTYITYTILHVCV